MHDDPPSPFRTWRRLYLTVLVYLVLVIIFLGGVTWLLVEAAP